MIDGWGRRATRVGVCTTCMAEVAVGARDRALTHRRVWAEAPRYSSRCRGVGTRAVDVRPSANLNSPPPPNVREGVDQ